MKGDNIYFPNLNGLRFIAALIVILAHIDMVNVSGSTFLRNYSAGQLGVILFFTLSGFLITYLLLVEEKKTNTISIKDFYIRRILRIWPLYYFLIFLFYCVLRYIPFFGTSYSPDIFSLKSIILELAMLPNVVTKGLDYSSPYLAHTWSIGVEEQFYLIWPVLMKYVKKKETLLISVIVGYLAIKFAILPILLDVTHYNHHLYVFTRVWNSFSIDCMAIGALFALWYFKSKSILKFLYNPILNWIILLFACGNLFVDFQFPHINDEIFSVFYGILILNLATNPKPIINLENNVFRYLGKISYGIYMYHMIGIVIALKLVLAIGIKSWGLQLVLTLFFTILISTLSYYLLEKRFINRKKKFSKIISGDNAFDK